MPICVTLTLVLPEIWGADEAWECGGKEAVKELLYEDLTAFVNDVNDADWKIEKVDRGAIDAPHDPKPSSSDLVDRLLRQREYWPPDDQALFVEAGVEIERLRGALAEIADGDAVYDGTAKLNGHSQNSPRTLKACFGKTKHVNKVSIKRKSR